MYPGRSITGVSPVISITVDFYIISSLCIECAKLIIQAGIVRVVYSDEYHTDEGCKLLKRAGIIVDFIHLNQEEK